MKTARNADSSKSLSNILLLTCSISSANSLLSSSTNHSKTASSFCRSPKYFYLLLVDVWIWKTDQLFKKTYPHTTADFHFENKRELEMFLFRTFLLKADLGFLLSEYQTRHIHRQYFLILLEVRRKCGNLIYLIIKKIKIG